MTCSSPAFWLPAFCTLGFAPVVAVAETSVPATAAADKASWQTAMQVMDNGLVRVGVDAMNGGRLVEYSLRGRNALYADPAHPEWVCPDNHDYIGPAGGRFDIGPGEALPRTRRCGWGPGRLNG
jgi:hypothetical protein